MTEDAVIIALFFERSEEAIAELDAKYGKLFHQLAHNILNSHEDAEECVNDAYISAWRAIPPEKPHFLRGYMSKMVRNISLHCYHRNTAQKRNGHYDVAMEEIETCLSDESTVENEMDGKELAHVIEAFLAGLSKDNRVIFMRRYAFADAYATIAERVGLSEKVVSVRLTRIRKQMKDYLREREVYV